MSNLANEGRIEAPPKRTDSVGDSGLDSVDRISLLQSDTGKETALKPESGNKESSEPDVLDFGTNDPLEKFTSLTTPDKAGTDNKDGSTDFSPESNAGDNFSPVRDTNQDGVYDTNDLTRKDKSDKPQETKNEKTREVSEKESDKPFDFVGDKPNLDPNKPTVVFLDHFKSPHRTDLYTHDKTKRLTIDTRTEISLNRVHETPKDGPHLLEEKGFTHGEFSSRMAEMNGFNAVRLQQNDTLGDKPADFSKSLNGIADLVENGKLNLGKGDVVNVSLGNTDPTFDQLNTLLKSNETNKITPENIDEPDVQKDILKRMAEAASRPNQNEDISNYFKNALATNKAIERLQSMGIEVAHAASNDGSDTVSLEFLKANHVLSSANSKTGKLDKFGTDNDLIDEGNGVLPIRFKPGTGDGENKGGVYIVEGTGVKFSAKEFGGPNKLETVNIGGENLPRDSEQLKKYYEEKIGRKAPPLVNENGHLVAVAMGNSYVNIQFLQGQKDRLIAMKTGDKTK